MRILDPTTSVERVTVAATSVTGLAGQRVALLTNQWKSWDAVTEMLASGVRERHGARSARSWDIPISTAAPESVLEEIAATSDVALVGLAN